MARQLEITAFKTCKKCGCKTLLAIKRCPDCFHHEFELTKEDREFILGFQEQRANFQDEFQFCSLREVQT